MSDTDNLYQSPQADINAVNPLAPTGKLTETMVFYLKGASPWLQFLGIIGFIGAGGTVLGGLVFLAAGIFGGSAFAEAMAELGSANTASVGIIGGISILTGIIIVVIGIVCFFPARFAYNFGTKVKIFLQNNSEKELELALKNNKSLWKFMGILTIIYLAVLPVTLITSIIVAISTSIFN
jgi:hypothetical protein